ncbi:hypothetical protein [Marinifilum flexuosum]|uniref:Uncharacterized protein n=1 Tax=Marinifilum flexuosum TaxID=1117708 RepID=A0A419WWM7_9BACT|nr:hypothetical protein [Marinifilum flexuosum]RKD99849.1 hypothetical protein BXY64_2830 [Marinifilum flexuosum]
MIKDTLSRVWMIFLFLLLLGFLFWGIFFVDDLQSKISILGIVAIIVAAFTSVLTVSINNKKAREREYELHILKEKQKVFEHFYNSYFEMLFKVKKGQNGLSRKAEEEMLLFKKGLMNWGSDRLIKKYIDFDSKLVESEGKQEKFNLFKDGDNFIKELRKELGYNDSKNVNIMSIILTAEARKELADKGLIK